MKKLVNLFYIFISVFITTSCSRNLYPPVLEIDLVKDNRYHIKEHETGHFLVNINPIEYKKNKHYMTLKGIVSYSGKDIYSQRYDTLINGIEGVTIFLCKMDRYKKELTIKKTLLKADCHGIFKISFKRNRKLDRKSVV